MINQSCQQATPRRDPSIMTMEELKAYAGDKLATTSWYRVTRDADKRIREASGGRFHLLSSRYRGDDQPHWIGDQDGRQFYASLNDIHREGLDVNPFYHQLPPDISRLGSGRGLSEYTHHISSGQAKAVSEQQLQGLDDDYMFYCSLHDAYYVTALRAFVLSARTTCNCPLCEEENSTP